MYVRYFIPWFIHFFVVYISQEVDYNNTNRQDKNTENFLSRTNASVITQSTFNDVSRHQDNLGNLISDDLSFGMPKENN